jgi:hypothetical protein
VSTEREAIVVRALFVAITLSCLYCNAYAQQYVDGIASSPQELTEAENKFMAHLAETNKAILEPSGKSAGRVPYAAVGQFVYCKCQSAGNKMFYSYLIAQEYGPGFGPGNDAL